MKQKLQTALTLIKESKACKEIPSTKTDDGIIILGGYTYADGLLEIFRNINHDYEYQANYKNLEGVDISNYTLKNIKTHLTYIERGERFCDGFIAGNIQNGTLQKLIERYLEILEE